MSRTYGTKYAETVGLTPVQIAALIRADLKQATASDGELAGLRVSVRCRDWNSITVAVDGLADADIHDVDRFGNVTRAARGLRVRAAVEAVANAYNQDNSDYNADYIDKRYYLHVVLLTDRDRAFNQRERERLATQRRNRATSRTAA